MRRFLLYIASLLLLSFIGLEVLLQSTGWAVHSVPKAKLNDSFLLQPGAEGVFRDGGRGEIAGHFSINRQGYNSLIDYSIPDDSAIYIALIGDSYIEGLQVDVEKSIGRQLEAMFDSPVVVHEFGRSGGNVHDYLILAQRADSLGYEYTFVLMSHKDLQASEPSFIGRSDKWKPSHQHPETLLETPVYLARNLDLNPAFERLFSQGPESLWRIHSFPNESSINPAGVDALKKLPASVVILHEPNMVNERFRSSSPCTLLEVPFEGQAYSFGFDKHWNERGRWICARTIADFLVDANPYLLPIASSTSSK